MLEHPDYTAPCARCFTPATDLAIREIDSILKSARICGIEDRVPDLIRGRERSETVGAYIVRRVFYGLISLWGISILTFVIVQLTPGDFVSRMNPDAWDEGQMWFTTEEDIAALRARWGLDKPLMVQYGRWMFNVLQGDLGFSIEYRKPVRSVIAERWLLTVSVAGVTILITWMLAIPIGIYSAVRQYSPGDHLFTFLGFVGLAVPNFLLALLLMIMALIWFGQSVTGLFSPEHVASPWGFARVADMLKHLWIPAIVLGTAGTAFLIRIMRANLLDELRKPYVVTARAKGLPERTVILKYPTRVAANPLK